MASYLFHIFPSNSTPHYTQVHQNFDGLVCNGNDLESLPRKKSSIPSKQRFIIITIHNIYIAPDYILTQTKANYLVLLDGNIIDQ